MVTGIPSQCSQQPATCYYYETDQSIPRIPKIHFNIIVPHALWFSRWSFPFRCFDRNLHALCSLSPRRATNSVQYILDLIIRIIYGEQYRSQSSSLCRLLHSHVTSSFLGPTNSISTLFSKILSQCSSLNFIDQISHSYKTTGKITF